MAESRNTPPEVNEDQKVDEIARNVIRRAFLDLKESDYLHYDKDLPNALDFCLPNEDPELRLKVLLKLYEMLIVKPSEEVNLDHETLEMKSHLHSNPEWDKFTGNSYTNSQKALINTLKSELMKTAKETLQAVKINPTVKEMRIIDILKKNLNDSNSLVNCKTSGSLTQAIESLFWSNKTTDTYDALEKLLRSKGQLESEVRPAPTKTRGPDNL